MRSPSGSGMAAIWLSLLGNLEAGDRVVIFVESYRPNRVAVRRFLPKLGLKFTMLSVHDLAGIEQAFAQDDTKLVLFEAPTNPMLQVPDLAAITALAKRHDVVTVLDNTFAGLHNHGRYEHRLLRAQPHEVRERPRRRHGRHGDRRAQAHPRDQAARREHGRRARSRRRVR